MIDDVKFAKTLENPLLLNNVKTSHSLSKYYKNHTSQLKIAVTKDSADEYSIALNEDFDEYSNENINETTPLDEYTIDDITVKGFYGSKKKINPTDSIKPSTDDVIEIDITVAPPLHKRKEVK